MVFSSDPIRDTRRFIFYHFPPKYLNTLIQKIIFNLCRDQMDEHASQVGLKRKISLAEYKQRSIFPILFTICSSSPPTVWLTWCWRRAFGDSHQQASSFFPSSPAPISQTSYKRFLIVTRCPILSDSTIDAQILFLTRILFRSTWSLPPIPLPPSPPQTSPSPSNTTTTAETGKLSYHQ